MSLICFLRMNEPQKIEFSGKKCFNLSFGRYFGRYFGSGFVDTHIFTDPGIQGAIYVVDLRY